MRYVNSVFFVSGKDPDINIYAFSLKSNLKWTDVHGKSLIEFFYKINNLISTNERAAIIKCSEIIMNRGKVLHLLKGLVYIKSKGFKIMMRHQMTTIYCGTNNIR